MYSNTMHSQFTQIPGLLLQGNRMLCHLAMGWPTKFTIQTNCNKTKVVNKRGKFTHLDHSHTNLIK